MTSNKTTLATAANEHGVAPEDLQALAEVFGDGRLIAYNGFGKSTGKHIVRCAEAGLISLDFRKIHLTPTGQDALRKIDAVDLYNQARRLCRKCPEPHYWNRVTGASVAPPSKHTYTLEACCPRHGV